MTERLRYVWLWLVVAAWALLHPVADGLELERFLRDVEWRWDEGSW